MIPTVHCMYCIQHTKIQMYGVKIHFICISLAVVSVENTLHGAMYSTMHFLFVKEIGYSLLGQLDPAVGSL